MAKEIHVHMYTKTRDFRGGPELKAEVRQALSTANRLLASASAGEAPVINRVIKLLQTAEQTID
jgi:hypothetical protein